MVLRSRTTVTHEGCVRIYCANKTQLATTVFDKVRVNPKFAEETMTDVPITTSL